MTNSRAAVVDWLRNKFAEEQLASFIRLKRVPDTRVIRFLDYFESLDAVEKSDLTATLAEWSSFGVLALPLPPSTVDQFAKATAFSERKEGMRYTGVKLLAALTKEKGRDGLDTRFRSRELSGLPLQPPESLLRNLDDLTPVKITTLRRLVKSAFRTASHHVQPRLEMDSGVMKGSLPSPQ